MEDVNDGEGVPNEGPSGTGPDDEPMGDGTPTPAVSDDQSRSDAKFAEMRRENERLAGELQLTKQQQQTFLDEVRGNPRLYEALMNPEPIDHVPESVKGNELAEGLFKDVGELKANQERLEQQNRNSAAQASKAAFDNFALTEAVKLGIDPVKQPEAFSTLKRYTLALATELRPQNEAQAREVIARAAKEMNLGAAPARQAPHVPASGTRRGGGPVETEAPPVGKEARLTQLAQYLRENEGMD